MAWRLVLWESPLHKKFTFTTGTVVWVLSTLYGILFGKSEQTGKWNPDAPTRKKILEYAARLAPYIFIFGILLALSVLLI